METVKFSKKEVRVIAHRGLSGIEAENTNAAFVAAGNRTYWGIETDVHKTADGFFVIIHDDRTGRVAKRDISVEQSSYGELNALTLKDKDGSTKRRDLIIPTLEEYIGICKKYDKTAVLELKNRFAYEDIEQVVKIIGDEDYLESTVFISFVLENLIDIRKILPNQKAQYLTDEFSDKILQALIENKLDLDIYYKNLNPEIVGKLKDNNIEINCWTCDGSEDAERLAEYGVDYITSNILE